MTNAIQRFNEIVRELHRHATAQGALFAEAEQIVAGVARAAYRRGGLQRQEEVNNALGPDRLAMDLAFVLAAAGLGAVVADPAIARAVMSPTTGEIAEVAAAFTDKWPGRFADHVPTDTAA